MRNEEPSKADDGQSRLTVGLDSAFQQAVHHAYAQTDGSYAWPNSREGDMLREAKREIENLRSAIKLYVSAGFGENTDFRKQGVAYDAAVEALR